MITKNEYYKDDVYYGAVILYGTSSDSKPTNYGNGSKFIECDTGAIYTFDATNKEWNLFTEGPNVNKPVYISALVDESPKEIGELPEGDWVCTVLYPLNLDITVATDSSNKIVVTSEEYRGAVVALCFKV